MAKKRKPMANSGSSEDESIERSSKKGQKSHKTVREEEVERLKMQIIQPTLEMPISKKTWASKGGPPPTVNLK